MRLGPAHALVKVAAQSVHFLACSLALMPFQPGRFLWSTCICSPVRDVEHERAAVPSVGAEVLIRLVTNALLILRIRGNKQVFYDRPPSSFRQLSSAEKTSVSPSHPSINQLTSSSSLTDYLTYGRLLRGA